MDKKIVALLGTAAALTSITAANAAASEGMSEFAPATSYRDLLDPIPNAVAALKADDARFAETKVAAGVQNAQFFYHHHHHHHFLPRYYFRRWYHHHHHHHHHHHFWYYR